MSGSFFRTRWFALSFAVSLHAVSSLVPSAQAEDFLMCRAAIAKPPAQLPNGLAVNPSNIQLAFKNILHTFAGDDLSAFFGITPSVLLLPDSTPNAFVSDPGHIILTKGLLQIIETRDELAFVVAHELGHVKLGHIAHNDRAIPALADRGTSQRELIERELQADKFALQLLSDSGLNPRAGLRLLGKIAALARLDSPGLLSPYPSLKVRLEALSEAPAAPLCGRS